MQKKTNEMPKCTSNNENETKVMGENECVGNKSVEQVKLI